MVNHQAVALDRTFAALADPTRRALLASLGRQQTLSVSDLARPFAMSLPAILKHLDVLSDAGLITRSKTGRTVACALTPAPMQTAIDWLSDHRQAWSERLDRLAAFVEQQSCPTDPEPPPEPALPSNAASKPRRRPSSPPGPTPGK